MTQHRSADYSYDPPVPPPAPEPDPPPPITTDYSADVDPHASLTEDLADLSTLNRKLVDQLTPFAGEDGVAEDACETLERLLTELTFLRTTPASTEPASDPVAPVMDLSDAMTPDEVAAVLAGSAASVIDIVSTAERRGGRDARDLDALETAELAGKARKTVLEAIHARRAAITPAP